MFDRIYEKNLIDKFIENRILTKDEISLFLDNYSLEGFQYIRDKAVSITRDNFGKNILIIVKIIAITVGLGVEILIRKGIVYQKMKS